MDPKTIEVKETPKSVFIGRDNWRKFLLGAVSALMFTTLIIIAVALYFLIDEISFFRMFVNHSGLWNGYDIAAYVCFVVALAVPSFSPNIGRKAFVPFFLMILGFYIYVPGFWVRVTWKGRFNLYLELVLGYINYSAAIIGLFINVISTKKKINPTNGVAISAVLAAIGTGVYCYVLKKLDPDFYKLLLLIGGVVAYSFYLNVDAMFMLNKRNDFYLNSDWFLGFVHFHTDIFFRFWVDIFRRDVHYIDTDTLNGKSVVLNSAIQKSRLAPISEVNEDNSDVEDMDRTKVSGMAGGKSMA